MDNSTSGPTDLSLTAKRLDLPLASVQATVDLLDEGNTVPFITRYRKDKTGGLDEQQIRSIQDAVTLQRQLDERKQRIIKSIQAQNQLTDELKSLILSASSLKALEDLYLPFKPKKQTLATVARQRGLEPLALEVISANPIAADFHQRCLAFVDPDKELATVAQVEAGVRHLIAEHFSELLGLRALVRRYMWSGKIVSKRIATVEKHDEAFDADLAVVQDASEPEPVAGPTVEQPQPSADTGEVPHQAMTSFAANETDAPLAPDVVPAEARQNVNEAVAQLASPAETSAGLSASPQPPTGEFDAAQAATSPESTVAESDDQAAGEDVRTGADTDSTDPQVSAEPPLKKLSVLRLKTPKKTVAQAKADLAKQRREIRREARRRKRQKLEQSFKDYADFSEPIRKLPPHRVLALNRGERSKVLRVRIDFDQEAALREAEQKFVSDSQPHAALLTECLRDAFERLVVPSIEREVRRELTEKSESHAVTVFARNLRKLLLQPPLHGHRVLAIDPGFKSGCKLVALDEFGNSLGHTLIHVIGPAQRVEESRNRLVEEIKKHNLSVVAIGNGTACRETEQLVAKAISENLRDHEVGYLIVNEAGASVYSTSAIGREELPTIDATVRGAVSIGRRAIDPLSELVKIDPASIGVGLYQHDVKAKHLKESLDAVVESCVNFVGVDVNSASPALLRYVSGLNQLTARRVYEYRLAHGPFKTRAELKQVPGVGEATFVQAAGFLKITDGENALDATWIHPESYEIAQRVLHALECDVSELRPKKACDSSLATTATNGSSPAERHEAAEALPGEAGPKPALAMTPESDQSMDSAAEAGGFPELSENPAAESKSPAPNRLAAKLAEIDVDRLADELVVGKMLLKDILSALARPGRDPREDLSPPLFRREVMKLEDLKPGMELTGTVLNVVDFGAFVDIGLSDSGLIHVSRMCDRFVSDPHDVISVGDIITVWVVDVDEKRRRISLTAIRPGTEKPKPERHPKPQQREEKKKPEQIPQFATKEKKGRRDKGKTRGGDRKRSGAWQPKSKPKPVVPITEAMAAGREPMRTFSDLQQFYQRRAQQSDDKPAEDEKKSQ
jgi:uncharacterized protein